MLIGFALSSFQGYRHRLSRPIWCDAAGNPTNRSSRRTNMFYIIGVVVVVFLIAGFFGLR